MAAAPASGARAPSDADAVMRRVAQMIAQSEQRQEQELARRLVQVSGDFDVQRRADLMRIQQALVGQNGEFTRNQRQMLDYIVRVSQPQQ